jgi:hypothetical protein
MRAFSGVMVGLSGSVLGVQAALAAAASAMLLFAALLLWRASAGRGEAPVASDRG